MDRPTITATGVTVTRTACPSWCAHDDLCRIGSYKGEWQRVPASADYGTLDADGYHFPIVELRAGHDVQHNAAHVWLTTTSTDGQVALTPAEARRLAAALLATADEIEGATR